MARTHWTNPSCNAAGCTNANTRQKVSWEGMPLGSSRNVLRKSNFLAPYAATATQESAPEITPRMVMAMMSQRWCKRPCSRRGSGTSAKHWRMETGLAFDMILLLRERDRTEKNHSCVQLPKVKGAVYNSTVTIVVRSPWYKADEIIGRHFSTFYPQDVA